jgi:hypothetical protein
MQVSLAASHFTLENLTCLVQKLKTDHSSKAITVFVFDSRYAADEFVPSAMERSPSIARSFKQLRATYAFDPDSHDEHVDLNLLGFDRESQFDSRIDLTSDRPPQCRFKLAGRCLVAFDTMDELDDPPMRRAGTVTLTGVIGRDGKMANTRVATSAGKASDRFVRAAVNNLKVWCFEARSHSDTIRITYTSSDATSTDVPNAELQIQLPSNVSIRASAVTTRQ